MKIFKANALFIFCLISFQVLAQKKPVVNQDPKTFKLFFEKTYLQLDRTYYNSGEDIWFAAYLVNGKSASLTSTSNNLYVELINPKSEIIDRKLIRIYTSKLKSKFVFLTKFGQHTNHISVTAAYIGYRNSLSMVGLF